MTRCSVTLVGLFASAAFGAAPELCNTPLFQDDECCFQFAIDVTCSGMSYPYIAGEWYLDNYGIENDDAGEDATTCLVNRQQQLSNWCGIQATMGFNTTNTTGDDPEGDCGLDCGLNEACDDLDPGMTLCIGCTATSCDPTDRVTQPWGNNTDPVYPSMGCPADYSYVCTKPDPSGYDPGAGASTAWKDSVEKCDTNGDCCVCLVQSNFDNSADVPLVATPQGTKNVNTVAADQAAVGKWAGWETTNYYNDVQCGWGPRDEGNSVAALFDEHPDKCPGNLGALPGSCSETGRLWSLSDVYGEWSCPSPSPPPPSPPGLAPSPPPFPPPANEVCEATLTACIADGRNARVDNGCKAYALGWAAGTHSCPMCGTVSQDYECCDLSTCHALCDDLYTVKNAVRLCKEGCTWMHDNGGDVCTPQMVPLPPAPPPYAL